MMGVAHRSVPKSSSGFLVVPSVLGMLIVWGDRYCPRSRKWFSKCDSRRNASRRHKFKPDLHFNTPPWWHRPFWPFQMARAFSLQQSCWPNLSKQRSVDTCNVVCNVLCCKYCRCHVVSILDWVMDIRMCRTFSSCIRFHCSLTGRAG